MDDEIEILKSIFYDDIVQVNLVELVFIKTKSLL